MRTRIFAIGMLILLAAAAAITAQTQAASDRLASAENAKRNKGPEAAIPIYESVCRDFPNDRPSCTKALVGIVKAYGYLEDADKFHESCQRLIAQYGDQPEVTNLCAPAKPRTRSGIFVAEMDPQTGVFRAPSHSLTENPESYEAAPTYSPDGRSLAFRKYPASATQAGIDRASFNSEIAVRSLDGKSERIINPCSVTQRGRSYWLSDGKTLVTFTSPINGTTGICLGLSDVQTGQVSQRVPTGFTPNASGSPATSNDGTTMYYTSWDSIDGTNFIPLVVTFDPSTAAPRQAFALPPAKGSPPPNVPYLGVSPDGRTAALILGPATEDARLVRFDTDGPDHHYQELVAGEGRMENVVWSKDGKKIFFARSSDGNVWQVMQVSAEGGGLPSFTGLEVSGLRYFDINRDNTQIVFDGLAPKISAPESYTRPAALDTPTPPAPSLPPANAPAAARGGARGARGNTTPSNARGQVVVMDRSGNVVTRLPDPLPTQNAGLSLSPDGTRVAVVNGGSLMNIDIASNMATLVASNVSNVPAWSPDGKRLAYRRSAGNGSLYMRSSDGSGPEELLHMPVSNLWNWSFDGRFILIGSGGNLVALSPDAGKTLTPVPGLTGGTGSRLSPDGKFIAYSSASLGGQVPVFVRPLDSEARAIKIADSTVGMIRWKSDGKEVYYLGVDGGVWSVEITATTPEIKTKSPVRLFAAPPGFTLQNGVSGALADVSASGDRFVFLAPLP